MTTEYVAGYHLTQDELGLEKGMGVDSSEVNKQADLVTQNWQIHTEKPHEPLLLMLGGFQGSGKTTTLELLVKDIDLLVISPDEIRYNLFSQKYPFSEYFVKLVNATKRELVERALKIGQSFVIDQSLTPDRINIVTETLTRYPNYRLRSVFLTAPEEVLIKRVSERHLFQGRYQGTVEELKGSIDNYKKRYGDPSLGKYNLIVDTEQNALQQVVNLIRQLL